MLCHPQQMGVKKARIERAFWGADALLHPLPTICFVNLADSCLVNAVCGSYSPLTHPNCESFAYLNDVGLGKFGARIPFAVRASIFAGHVGMIVMRRTQEKMFWIAALRIVTSVANIDADFNRPLVNHVRKTMGVLLLALLWQLHLAIARASR